MAAASYCGTRRVSPLQPSGSPPPTHCVLALWLWRGASSGFHQSQHSLYVASLVAPANGVKDAVSFYPPVWLNVNLWQKHARRPSRQTTTVHTWTKRETIHRFGQNCRRGLWWSHTDSTHKQPPAKKTVERLLVDEWLVTSVTAQDIMNLWLTTMPRQPTETKFLRKLSVALDSGDDKQASSDLGDSSSGSGFSPVVRTDNNRHAWNIWTTAWNRFLRLRQPGSTKVSWWGRNPLVHLWPGQGREHVIAFFCLMAAWLNEVVVRAVALLSALTKEYNMHIIQCCSGNCTSQVWTQNTISSLPESAVICISESNSIQRKSDKCGDNPKIVGVGRRLSESLEQGLVMAPPRARMTNDRSTGVAINVKLAGIGTSRRLLRYRPQAAADYADCAVK